MPHPVPVRRTALFTALALACGPVAPITTYTSPATGYQNQAAGKPIFDCTGLQATADRMRAGLPAQDEAIRRTQEQLDAARTGVKESVQEAQLLALKEATNAAVHQLDYVRETKSMIAKSAASNADRLKWNAIVDKIKDAAEKVQNATTSGASGLNIGTAIRENQLTLSTFAKELEGSGISDELGKAAATAIAGPAGGLAVEIGISARDAIAAGWGLYNNVSEADAAQRNLDTMRQARSSIDSRIYEINDILKTECAPPPPPPQDRIMTRPPAAEPPPYTPVPDPAPQQAAPAHHGGGGGAVVGVLLAGAAGVAVYGYAKNKYGTTDTTTCTAPTADIVSICAAGGGSSACQTALANQTTFCKCEGYAGFNAGSGRCQ
jgi:hypothetical protein